MKIKQGQLETEISSSFGGVAGDATLSAIRFCTEYQVHYRNENSILLDGSREVRLNTSRFWKMKFEPNTAFNRYGGYYRRLDYAFGLRFA